MKKYYLLLLFITLVLFKGNSQDDLLGTWYLDYIVKDGVTYPNYFNDNTIFEMDFTNTSGGFPNSLFFSSGHGCNASNGFYVLNTNTITISLSGTTQADCLTAPFAIYEELFLNELSYDITNESNFNYEISGTGNDEVLTFTNPNNSNILVLKRQQPTTLLVRTWWLHHIDIPGNPIIDIPDSDFPNITFSNDIINPLPMIPEAEGVGECEIFNCKYGVTFNGANNLSTNTFVQTLAGCATQAYEGIYFSILGNDSTNFFEFEIIDNGGTLILTDILGAKLIYGDVPLSIDDQTYNSEKISLKQNPVGDEIILEIDNFLFTADLEYSIYSIEGKLIKSFTLNSDSVDVAEMPSGIYFISCSHKEEPISTLKFIKK